MGLYYCWIAIFAQLAAVKSLLTPYWAHCRLSSILETFSLPLEQLQPQRIPSYSAWQHSRPVPHPRIPLLYTQLDYYYHSFINAGGSGEVFLVEETHSNKGRVVKRYLKEEPIVFQRQNYVMREMGQAVEWTKDCRGKCKQNSTFHTMAVFPHHQTLSLLQVEFEPVESRLIFYKTLRELSRLHSKGIVHNDIKMGNILVHAVTEDFKFFKLQLIDWNLATPYYTGYDSSKKGGTPCYHSPETLFQANHRTPASDIWSLGVLFYTFITDGKPFSGVDCKEGEMEAVLSLVGAEQLLSMARKYGYRTVKYANLLAEAEAKLTEYPRRDIGDLDHTLNGEHLTEPLLDLLRSMLVVDPEERATASELMQMPYFRSLKQLPPVGEEKEQQKQQKEERKKENEQ